MSSSRSWIQLTCVEPGNPRAGKLVGVDVVANHRRRRIAGYVELLGLQRVNCEVIVVRLVALRRTWAAISLATEICVALLTTAGRVTAVARSRLQSRCICRNV